jgi:phenylpyruvate tautomerase PptA (4-oxalocrotonate tautomerase family)
MPLYECLTQTGTLTQEQRTEIAEAITRIHAEETNSPADFIHVFFPEIPAGQMFTAGREAAPALLRGVIRAGRPAQVRESIMRRINDLYQDVTGTSPMKILVALFEAPAQWGMEGGEILPEPNQAEEDAWFAALRARAAEPERA